LRQLSPTVPLRSDEEKKLLCDAIDGLNLFQDSFYNIRLMSPKIVASNATSQFRLFILDESAGRVEVRRTGRGWGRDLTVAAVVFSEDADFKAFLEMGSFAEVKKYLAQSVLRQREIGFRSGGDSQVQTLHSSAS
jgi:hypothetical protein